MYTCKNIFTKQSYQKAEYVESTQSGKEKEKPHSSSGSILILCDDLHENYLYKYH